MLNTIDLIDKLECSSAEARDVINDYKQELDSRLLESLDYGLYNLDEIALNCCDLARLYANVEIEFDSEFASDVIDECIDAINDVGYTAVEYNGMLFIYNKENQS